GAPLAIRIGKDGQLSETGQALIPGVDELTKKAVAGLKGGSLAAATAIIDGLGAGANIEAVLTKVRLLEMALGTTKISGLDGNGYQLLGEEICKNIGKIVLRRYLLGEPDIPNSCPG